MAKTSIEWTDESTNPIRARHRRTGKKGHYCEMFGPGCLHCYASNFQPRFKMPKFPGKQKPTDLELVDGFLQVNDDIDLFMDVDRLKEVIGRKKPTKIFWCDMTDLFGWWVPHEWIDLCFATMALSPQHTHQVLTKRAVQLSLYMESRAKSAKFLKAAALKLGYTLEWQDISVVPFPLPNVWLGVSCENQRAVDDRIDWLRKTPAAVRFVSAEPLLEGLDLEWSLGLADTVSDLPWLDWIIVGGESGHGARPCAIGWIENIVKQCSAARVPCFVKQLGAKPVNYAGEQMRFEDRKGGEMETWPRALQVREFPKAA